MIATSVLTANEADYMRIGIPLSLVVAAVALGLIPLVWGGLNALVVMVLTVLYEWL